MGTVEGLKYAGIGFLVDRVLNTGFLGTLAGGVFGALFKPDAGEMSDAYDKRKATVGQTLKDFFGYEMTDTLFGTASTQGKKASDLRPNRERAKAKAQEREKKDGFPWGKVALGVGAAFLGMNLLDTFTMGPFSNPLFAPCGVFPGYPGVGLGGGGVLPMALMALLGLNGSIFPF